MVPLQQCDTWSVCRFAKSHPEFRNAPRKDEKIGRRFRDVGPEEQERDGRGQEQLQTERPPNRSDVGLSSAAENPGGLIASSLSVPLSHWSGRRRKRKLRQRLSAEPAASGEGARRRSLVYSQAECHCDASGNDFQACIHSSGPPHYAGTQAGSLSAAQHTGEGEKEKEKERIENERRSCCSVELCLTGGAQEE